MYRGNHIAVVIPCFNVAGHLPDVLRTMPDFVDHMIVVDDGSHDEPAAVVPDSICRSRISVVHHECNRGLARAMETGFRRALELGADVIVKMDGDGQMDPEALPRLLGPIVSGAADLSKGNRFLQADHLRGMPLVRLLGNIFLSFFTKVTSGYWNVFDPTNGYLAIRRQLLEDIDLSRLGPGYFLEISLLCEAYLSGAVVRDTAVEARYNGQPSSLSVGWAALAFPMLMARACARRVALQHFLRDFTPVALFLLTGLLLVGGGLSYGLAVWLHNSRVPQPTPPGTIALASLAVLAGSQLLIQALVLDIGSVPSRSPYVDLDQHVGSTGS